jgi:hypothetical protein
MLERPHEPRRLGRVAADLLERAVQQSGADASPMIPAIVRQKLTPVAHEGDGRIGGHTPGLQITLLERANGPIVFACDASHFYENLETKTTTALIYNYHEYQRGFTLIEELAAGGRWFPGHDPRMLEGLEPVSERVYRVT